jgi:hypothetical protein
MAFAALTFIIPREMASGSLAVAALFALPDGRGTFPLVVGADESETTHGSLIAGVVN